MSDGKRIFEEATGVKADGSADREAVMEAVVKTLSDAMDSVRELVEGHGGGVTASSFVVEAAHKDWERRGEVRHLIGFGEPVSVGTVRALTNLMRNTAEGFQRSIDGIVDELMNEEGEE